MIIAIFFWIIFYVDTWDSYVGLCDMVYIIHDAPIDIHITSYLIMEIAIPWKTILVLNYCLRARFTNARNSNSMETSPCCYSVAGYQIATNFSTCHDSTAVVPCTKFYSDHCIRIEQRVKQNFHRIWIAIEKPLVKRGLGLHCNAAVHSSCSFRWQSAMASHLVVVDETVGGLL